jgi:hypothetical protein
MMRKFIGVALFVSLVSLMGFTQETPKPEVFGGYQYTRFDGGTNAHGFNGQATMYINKWLGVSGDFGGAFPSGGKFLSYTGGPVVSTHKGQFSPFAHFLIGGAHASATDPLSGTTVSANGLAMMPGGGIDMGRKQLAVRLVQFDWLISRFSGVTDKNNARISSGLLFRF